MNFRNLIFTLTRVINWGLLVALVYTLLHYIPSFKVIGLFVLEKKIFKVFTWYGRGDIGHWPELFEQLFVLPTPGGYTWNLITIGPVVSEEKSFEIVDGRRRRRRTTKTTTDPAYTKNCPETFGTGALKSTCSYSSCSLDIFWWCFTFVPNFVKISWKAWTANISTISIIINTKRHNLEKM